MIVHGNTCVVIPPEAASWLPVLCTFGIALENVFEALKYAGSYN